MVVDSLRHHEHPQGSAITRPSSSLISARTNLSHLLRSRLASHPPPPPSSSYPCPSRHIWLWPVAHRGYGAQTRTSLLRVALPLSRSLPPPSSPPPVEAPSSRRRVESPHDTASVDRSEIGASPYLCPTESSPSGRDAVKNTVDPVVLLSRRRKAGTPYCTEQTCHQRVAGRSLVGHQRKRRESDPRTPLRGVDSGVVGWCVIRRHCVWDGWRVEATPRIVGTGLGRSQKRRTAWRGRGELNKPRQGLLASYPLLLTLKIHSEHLRAGTVPVWTSSFPSFLFDMPWLRGARRISWAASPQRRPVPVRPRRRNH